MRASIGSCAGTRRRRARTGAQDLRGTGVASAPTQSFRSGCSRSPRGSSWPRTPWRSFAPVGRRAVAGSFSTRARTTRAAGAVCRRAGIAWRRGDSRLGTA